MITQSESRVVADTESGVDTECYAYRRRTVQHQDQRGLVAQDNVDVGTPTLPHVRSKRGLPDPGTEERGRHPHRLRLDWNKAAAVAAVAVTPKLSR